MCTLIKGSQDGHVSNERKSPRAADPVPLQHLPVKTIGYKVSLYAPILKIMALGSY